MSTALESNTSSLKLEGLDHDSNNMSCGISNVSVRQFSYSNTVDGRNPSPVDMVNIHYLLYRVLYIPGFQDFFYQQYGNFLDIDQQIT